MRYPLIRQKPRTEVPKPCRAAPLPAQAEVACWPEVLD